MTQLINTLLLSLLCVAVSTATWIPQLELPRSQWVDIYPRYDILSTYKTCSDVHSGSANTKFIQLYKKTPATIVISGHGSGFFDVKFQDSLYTFDNKITLTDAEPCVIIPPHQPVDWVMLDLPGGDGKVCVYEDTITEVESRGSTTPHCACNHVLQNGAACSVMKIPHTIRKPEHEFFMTAELAPEDDDVTICTILTVDRMLRLSQMSEFWGGPISAAVYLHDHAEIKEVYNWWLTNTSMRRHVDIHIVVDDKIVAFELPDRAFPVNILRNVGIRFARTANVFYIEGDFIPSRDLYPSLADVKKRLASGERSVFIVAPFSSYKVDFDMNIFPNNKQELKKLINTPDNLIKSLSYYNSHAAFRYERWYDSTTVEKMGYSGGFEPYYIGPKTYPLFDEIFIGCGADKVSHPNELSQRGYEFYVLPTGFIVHLDSTGMGTAWCKSWGGTKRSSLKWETFSRKVDHMKSGTAFNEPWWDLAPVPRIGNGRSAAATKDANGALICPPCAECKKCETALTMRDDDGTCPECPECQQCQECRPATARDCRSYIEGYETEVSLLKRSLQVAEELVEKQKGELKKQKDHHTKRFDALQEELKQLRDTNFFTNIILGSLVVAVIVGVVWCVWPKSNKTKVWNLPAFGKPSHHHL